MHFMNFMEKKCQHPTVELSLSRCIFRCVRVLMIPELQIEMYNDDILGKNTGTDAFEY